MAERTKAGDLKSLGGFAARPWVRIPPPPPFMIKTRFFKLEIYGSFRYINFFVSVTGRSSEAERWHGGPEVAGSIPAAPTTLLIRNL